MLIKFKNCEIDLWKVRRGCVVLGAGRVGHINKIGFPETLKDDKKHFCIDIVSTEADVHLMSYEVEWLEPH